MPFDPNIPLEFTLADAAQMRAQFNGLKDLIDAVSGITAVQVDGVTTLPAGSQATVSLQLTGNTLHFTFGIPEGPPGSQGEPGIQGPPGTNAPNSNAVSTLGQGADGSYNQTQMQALLDKMDELINALRVV